MLNIYRHDIVDSAFDLQLNTTIYKHISIEKTKNLTTKKNYGVTNKEGSTNQEAILCM